MLTNLLEKTLQEFIGSKDMLALENIIYIFLNSLYIWLYVGLR